MTLGLQEKIGYAVDYSSLDHYKRACLAAARTTAENLERWGFKVIPCSWGENTVLIDCGSHILAFVVEGLGTENLVAEEMQRLTGKSYLFPIATNWFATIVNDLASAGAEPLVINQFLAMGSSDWLKDSTGRSSLIEGWLECCNRLNCVWGGGETQQLRDIIMPGTAVLAGGAVGIIKPKRLRIKGDVRPGDSIIILRTATIHANGLTMARDVAAKLPDGYLTELPDKNRYGDWLLQPTPLYNEPISFLLNSGVQIRYASPITGHGWRKIMRLDRELSYRFDSLPQPSRIFRFIQEQSGADDDTMYSTFNMSGGLALFVRPGDTARTLGLLEDFGESADVYGKVFTGKREVILPNGVAFDSDDYAAR